MPSTDPRLAAYEARAALAFGIYRFAGANLARGAQMAIAQGAVASAKGVNEAMKGLAENTGAAKKYMEAQYIPMAGRARAAILDRLEESFHGPGPYRPGDRQERKTLVRAIEEGSFIAGTSQKGILMLNKAKMSRIASQWIRLNFGAGQRGQGANTLWQIHASNVMIGEIGIIGKADKRPMLMPAGIFMGADRKPQRWDVMRRGMDKLMFRAPFHKKKAREEGVGKKMIVTQGMEAKDFMSIGAESLAIDYSRALEVVAGKMVKGSRPKVGVQRVQVRV